MPPTLLSLRLTMPTMTGLWLLRTTLDTTPSREPSSLVLSAIFQDSSALSNLLKIVGVCCVEAYVRSISSPHNVVLLRLFPLLGLWFPPLVLQEPTTEPGESASEHRSRKNLSRHGRSSLFSPGSNCIIPRWRALLRESAAQPHGAGLCSCCCWRRCGQAMRLARGVDCPC